MIRWLRPSFLSIPIVLVLFAAVGFAQKKAEKSPPKGEEIEGLGLTVAFPENFAATRMPGEKNGQVVASWLIKCGQAQFRLGLRVLPIDKFHFDEPLDVSDLILENESRDQPGFAYDEQKTIPGPFGTFPHAICARSALRENGKTSTSGVKFYLCGLTDKAGYVFEMPIEPLPDAALMTSARAFLASGIVWKGKALDPKWSKEEAQARWDSDVPDAKKNKLDKVLRTEHYIILTNSSGGNNFSKAMEENYTKIKAVFAFEEMPGERLMPVFLFRNPEEYYGFFAQQFKTTIEQARKSKGVASGDFYATWYEAPGDPVHIHEGTHQVFGNRLRLRGGGSWFQEGVAEYMSSVDNERSTAARNVKKSRQKPLAEFVKIPSLLFSPKGESKTGEDDASSQYELASFLIEFVRESKFSKEHFVDWIHAVGAVPRNDVAAVEAATKKTLGVDLAGFEKEWVEYAKKR